MKTGSGKERKRLVTNKNESMREIKTIGQKRQGKRSYLFSLFECDCCGLQIEKIRKDGLAAKSCSHKCYAKNRNRRGAYKSGVVEISGYLYEYKPQHPNATKSGYVAQHRLVAEKNIGRHLNQNEVAHHKNENKKDNSASNIEVMTASQHSIYHQNLRKCKTGL